MELYNNWREEMRSAYLYGILAKSETNILHRKLFADLHDSAIKQAVLWEEKIKQQHGKAPGTYVADTRARIVGRLVIMFGAERLHSLLSAMKIRGMSVFSRYHAEHKHTSFNSASNLRAAVFGINDGLISNMSLLLGVAGASVDSHYILITGVAGLLAGACSMGAGEYISVRSQREVFEYQIAIEAQELKEYPEEEMEELNLIYQARGIPPAEAEKLARIMIENPETGLDTLAREELGLNPDDLVSPVGAMLSSFFAFAFGAIVPLLPFLFLQSVWNLEISMALTGITLFGVGAVLSLFTNKNPILLGLRMMLIGAVAGTLTFFIGKWLGVSLS